MRAALVLTVLAVAATALVAVSAPGAVTASELAAAEPKVVFLTFDDGPSDDTASVLRVLSRYDAHATFFVIGSVGAQRPRLLRAEVSGGHAVADHTWSHVDLTTLSDDGVRRQLSRTARMIRLTTSRQTLCFRPPFRATDAQVVGIGSDLGLRQVLWDVDPRDWSDPGVRVIVRRVMDAVHDRAVVDLHDGGGDRSQTVAALRRILPRLVDGGYRMRALRCMDEASVTARR